MATLTRGIWRALKEDNFHNEGDVLIGEEEVEKENFSLLVEAPEKGKGNPLLARTAASTSNNSANANFEGAETSGPNYSHIANSFIVGPSNAQKFATSSSRYTTKVKMERSSRVSKRSMGRGK